MKTKGLLAIVLAMALVMPFAGCGGGGSDSTSTADTSGGDTGTVALMLTDGPADDYDHIWVTIIRAMLLTEEGQSQVVIFDPDVPVEYDLLNLRPEDDSDAGELLALEDVPTGLYTKIRLEVEAVRGETVLPDGSTEETSFKLSSGKIDLNPRGQFYVAADTTIAITLDIDCDKSIHVSGNHINFRPVVFVSIDSPDQLQRCPRFLHGTISTLIYGDDGETLVGFELNLLNSGRTVEVSIDETTVIIDDSSVSTDPQSLAVGDTVFVRAQLLSEGLVASLVVVGDVDRVAGVVDQAVTDNQFVLDLYLDIEDDEQIVELIPDTTLILWGCGEEATPEAIQPGMRARVIGKVQDDGSIFALVVLLSPRYASGHLESMEIAEGGYELNVNVAEADEEPKLLSIFLPSDAPINVKFDGPLTGDELMALVECEARSVLIAIDRTVPPPLTAAKITVLSEPLQVTVVEVNSEERQILTDQGLIISIADQARIFDLLSPSRLMADISDIVEGDQLLLYGLSLCEPEEASFLAHVVMIMPPFASDGE